MMYKVSRQTAEACEAVPGGGSDCFGLIFDHMPWAFNWPQSLPPYSFLQMQLK